MAFLDQGSKVIVVLVLVVALFAFIIGLMVGLPLAVIQLDTQSHSFNAYGFEARGGIAGQYLDASQYVTSWSPSLDSEKIVARAEGTRYFGSLACVTEYRYRFYTTSNGLSWNELSTSPYTYPNVHAFTTPGTFLPLVSPDPFALRGLYEGGLKMDLEFHIKDVAGPGCTLGIDKGFLVVGSDQAYLRSGVGSIRAPAQAQVGDPVRVCVDIPYVASEKDPGKGWVLYGFSTAQNREILRVDPIAASGTTCYVYTVAPADFVQSPSCTTENRLEWHLFNELWAKDFAFTTTIDVSAFAPSLRITGVSGLREVGKPISISWNAIPNPSTRYPILRVVLAWGYGEPSTELVFGPDKTSTEITPGSGGLVHLEAYAVDTGCRPSPVERLDLQIREPGQGGAPVVEPNLLLFLLPIAALTVIGLVIAVAIDLPLYARFLVALVFLIAGLLIGIVLVPAVLFPGG